MTSLIEGKYEILQKLKEGGMGAIYKVRHVLLDEVRVIKVMRPQIEDDPDAQRRFQQEARMATSLKHPNIAALLDFAEDKDHTFYMVMEFIDGANLAEFSAKSGPPPLPSALDIGIQTLRALGYLHKRGIIHRDISPENIMLAHDAEGRVVVKLIDLGVAKQEGSQGMTLTGMFVGKLKYGSPEQLGVLKAGEKIDGRSDIYSLGCVMYQLLTGQSAFAADSMQAYVMHHLMHPPRPFEESDLTGKVPADVRAAVLKALEKKRDDRWATADEFADALEEARDRLELGRDEETAEMADLMRVAAQRSAVQQKPSGISEAEAKLARAFAGATPAPTAASPIPPAPTPNPSTPGTSVRTRGTSVRPAPPPLEPPPFDVPTSRTVVTQAAKEAEVFQRTARTVVPAPRRESDATPPPQRTPVPAVRPVPVSPPLPATARGTGTRNVRLWGLVAAGVAVIVLVGVFLAGRGKPSAPVAPGSIPPAAAPGAVLLTAEPWAHVAKVVEEASGKEVALGDVVTPARVSLPPGKYAITLRADDSERQVVATVDVPAGGEVPLHAVIPGFDLDKAVSSYVR